MTRYGLQGVTSGELITYGGRVLVHDNPAELAFLIAGARVVTIPRGVSVEQTLPIAAHPELAGLRWPLRREDFR